MCALDADVQPSPPDRRDRPPFAAFLSYRHADEDRRWASWLLRGIESYRVPRHLGAGPRRLGKVFRDEEELAASPDLSASIRDALERSRFLIVVCTPRTPASRWIDREIEMFHQLGKGDRIMAFLVDGTSDMSFPAALRAVQREPLAADARPRHGMSARQARRTALLRVLSRLIGCEYDDLRQRDLQRRQRMWRNVAALASVLVLAFAALAGLAIHSRNEARRERDRALALGLAQAAAAASEQDPQRGLLLARHAAALHAAPETRSRLRAAIATPGARWRVPAGGRTLGVAVSPDGTRAIVHELGGRVRVLDEEGRVLADLKGAKVADGPRFAPDGSYALVAGEDGVLLRLDANGTRQATARPASGDAIEQPWIDGRTGMIWARDGAAVVRLDAQLQEQARFEAPGVRVAAFAPFPAGDRVAVRDPDGRILVLEHDGTYRPVAGIESWAHGELEWEVPGAVLRVADGHSPSRRVDLATDPATVSPLPDTALLLPFHGREVRVEEDDLVVRDMEGAVRARHRVSPLRRLVADGSGRAAVALTTEGDLLVLDSETGRLSTWSGARAARPEKVASARGGSVVVLATQDDGVLGIDLSRAELGAHGAPVRPAAGSAWLADGSAFLAIEGPLVQRWSAQGRHERTYATPGRRVVAAAASMEGARVLAGFEDGSVRVWTAEGHLLAEADAQIGGILEARPHAGGKGWIVAGGGGAARLVREDGSLGARLVGHTGPVTQLAGSSDGARLLTGTRGEEVRLWRGDGEPVALLHLGGDRVRYAAFLEGTDRAALVGPSRARLFDAEGRVLGYLEAGLEPFSGGVATPDGRLLVYGGRLRLLDAEGGASELSPLGADGAQLAPDGTTVLAWHPGPIADLVDVGRARSRPLGGHTGGVTAAAFLPADRGLATGTAGGAVHLWTASGALRAVLDLGGGAVADLQPDPTGRHLLVVDDQGTMRHVLLGADDVDALAARRTTRALRWRERRAYADFLGDPGPDPTQAQVDRAVALLEQLAEIPNDASLDAETMPLVAQVEEAARELGADAAGGERITALVAAIARHRPEDARRLEAQLDLKVHLLPTTLRKLAALHRALQAFHDEHGRHPTDDEGLAVLDREGRILTADAARGSPLLDAWGALFLYRATADGYRLTSAGPDGRHGTEDDLR